MTTKRIEMQAEIDRQKERIWDLENKSSSLTFDLYQIENRLRAEFFKHTPKIPDRFWRNDVAEPGRAQDFICSFDDCGFYWPCPTWFALRRIAGKDDGAKSLTISLEKDE